jgi:putative oxidoreductase
MTPSTSHLPDATSSASIVNRIRVQLNAVPYWVLAIPLRLAVAIIFWNSAMTKLANWDTAVTLFAEEYKLPLLPPELAAYLAISIELAAPVLLVLGLLTRPTALVLLGMTAVIEIFVYPLAWPTHLQWAAILLVLLCRGPGRLSLDHLLGHRLGGHASDEAQRHPRP